ncbi:MAG: hypothetical protein LQ341_006849 [Variospora aurantia]|nr:MAG: hypothetical protein LQ341_006849 [Variospora aurantia]
MSQHLRGFVSRRLSLVGIQLQVFWKKTSTSGHSLKQALSPQPSRQSSISPSTTPTDAPSQETFLPVFSVQSCSINNVTLDNEGNLPHGYKLVQAAPGADPSLYRIVATNSCPEGTRDGGRQTEISHDSAIHHHPPTGLAYASASTQFTEQPTLTREQSPMMNEGERDTEEISISDEERNTSQGDDDPLPNSETEVSDESERPEIYDGQSQAVVADFGGKKHLALLVTQGMIEDLNVMRKYSTQLERMVGKLSAANDKVALARIDCQYYEERLQETEVQDEIDELHEKLERYRTTLPADERRLDDLQRYADLNSIHIKTYAETSLDTLQTVLADAGLLKTHFERDQWEPVDENDCDGNEEHGQGQERAYCSESAIGMLPFDGNSQCTDYSRVSVDELYRRAVEEEVRQKYRAFYEADHAFEIRHIEYGNTKARYQQLVHAGECSMTQTEFDHCDFEATRELANEMAAAEEAYEDALTRRNRLGLGGSDQESDFINIGDGYPLSWEGDALASAPRTFIEDWMEDIPEVENFPDIVDLTKTGGDEFGRKEPEDGQDWEIQSAHMSDTWSCRDLTRNRKRIDRWNEITGREK